jgi:hypothetical protein
MRQDPTGFAVHKTYCAVLDFIHKNDWQGACHGSSAVFAVLLMAQGLQPTLCLGEVRCGDIYFDHSWVEIDGEIFDAAISKTLIHGLAFPPVFRSHDLSSKHLTTLEYGQPSGQRYDESAAWIRTTSVSDYMRVFPDHPDGLWGIAKAIGKTANIRVTLASLKKHSDVLRWAEGP